MISKNSGLLLDKLAIQFGGVHVFEDVIAGRAQPLTGGDDALGNMRAIDAIYRAAGLMPRGLST